VLPVALDPLIGVGVARSGACASSLGAPVETAMTRGSGLATERVASTP